MGKPTLEMKLQRIGEFAMVAEADDWARTLLHAYAACLKGDELCEAVIRTMDNLPMYQPLVNRLVKTGQEGRIGEHLDRLAIRLMGLVPVKPRRQIRIEALLSRLYPLFSPPTRQAVLDRWRRSGSADACGRWLKAVSEDDLLFSISDILRYWRVTGDQNAAGLLVRHGDAGFLEDILPELIATCGHWSDVSLAAQKVAHVSEDCWEAIRERFPPTYTYLCAMLGRQVAEEDVFAILHEIKSEWPANNDGAGVVIWSVGKLGMWSALERVREMLPAFRREAEEVIKAKIRCLEEQSLPQDVGLIVEESRAARNPCRDALANPTRLRAPPPTLPASPRAGPPPSIHWAAGS